MKDRMTFLPDLTSSGMLAIVYTDNNPDDIRSGILLSLCCRDWCWPFLMFSVSLMTAKNLQRRLFYIEASVGSGTIGRMCL